MRTLTLTFHGIGSPSRRLDAGEDRFWLTIYHFHRVLDAVAETPDVELTFDDGNVSDLAVGLPALRARGLRATFFVLAGRLGSTGFLGEADLRELGDQGMKIGSHGMNHRSWRKLDAETMRVELVDAKRRIEQVVGRPVTEAACPFGAYDRRALGNLRQAGFDAVYTSDGGLGRTGHWLKARNTVGPHDDPSIVTSLLQAPTSVLREGKQLLKRLR